MYTTTQAYTPGEQLDSTRRMLVAMNEKGMLQSYVAQHKNSPEYPFLLALATSINQVSNATKAAQHRPPTQTVADQKLNALAPAPAPQASTQLPENVGIGQLPAPNLSTINKAEGGIVAFGDGGEIPRFQSQGAVKYPYGMTGTQATGLYDIPGLVTGNAFGTVNKPDLANRIAEIEAMRRASRAVKDQLIAQAKADAGAATTQSPLTSPVRVNQPAGPRVPDNSVVPAAVDQAAAASADKATAQTDKTLSADEGRVTAKTPAPTGSPGIGALLEENKKYLPAGEKAPTPADRAAFMTERETARAPSYEKLNKMLEGEKDKLKGDKEQAFFMSMIESGLAAAGGTSQYGLQNLAQGFSKGAASFSDAMKDLRKAARENAKMEVEAERMKAADKINDMDAFQRSEESYKQRQATRDAAMTSGIFGLTGDKMRADATVQAAGASANAQRNLMEALGKAEPDSALRKGFDLTKLETQTQKAFEAWQTRARDPITGVENAAFLKLYPTPDTYVRDFLKMSQTIGNGGILNIPDKNANANQLVRPR